MSKPVYVVHCVDTEGPLFESREATFDRLENIFNISLEPTESNYQKLINGELDFGEQQSAVEQAFSEHLLDYNSTWDQLEQTLDKVLSENFRNSVPDSEGNGWIFNWFCVDHVNYDNNPRRRDMGYGNIFERYKKLLKRSDSKQDGLHFHYHPHSVRNDAHRCGSHWLTDSNRLFQILNRRIIDHNWFPAANRPGFHITRPDSHWFLEQYIPFDYANQAMKDSSGMSKQKDFSAKKEGDWTRAPVSWSPYHPSHDDHEQQGDCRRWIAKCLNIGTRFRLLNKEEIELAFEEAKQGRPVLLAFTNHDFRDIAVDVKNTHQKIKEVSAQYSDVDFLYREAVEGFRQALELDPTESIDFNINIKKIDDRKTKLIIKTDIPTFGPQPYFCFKTTSDDYYHDNLNIIRPFHKWSFLFDRDSFPIDAIEKIGLAANNNFGVTTVVNYDPRRNKKAKSLMNDWDNYSD